MFSDVLARRAIEGTEGWHSLCQVLSLGRNAVVAAQQNTRVQAMTVPVWRFSESMENNKATLDVHPLLVRL